MRSLMKDSSVRHHKLSAGTLRRILGFARPYRGYLAFFLVLVAFDAAIGAVTPLLFKAIIDKGIVAGPRPGGRLARRSSSPCWPSSTRASRSASAGSRRASARGSIFDMRTAVFAHVQRMPHRVLHAAPRPAPWSAG